MGRLSFVVIPFLLLLACASAFAADAPAPPSRSYAIPCRPSELIRRHDALLALTAQVRADLTAAQSANAASDPALVRRRNTTLFQIAVLERDTLAAHRALERVRATYEAAVQRAVSGLFTQPYLEARVSPGDDFRAAFRERLSRRLASLPYAEVDFTLQAVRGQMASATPDTSLGTARAALDPLAADGRLPAEAAATLIALAVNDELVGSVREDLLTCLDAMIAAHQDDAEVFTAKVGVLKPPLRGAWFGQKPPGRTPQPFAPAILDSVSRWCNGVAFSPDGRECFLSIGGATYGGSLIAHATCAAGVWTPFAPLACLDGFVTAMEPHFSPDGRTLYFTGKPAGGFRRLYAITRAGATWGAPVLEPAPIEGEGDAYRGSRTDDGTWYFGLQEHGMPQIRRATPGGAAGLRVEMLGPPVDQGTYEGDPCIAPDGRWLVFNSARNAAVGGSDLYVSFPDGKGDWGTPIPLGPAYNSPADEYGAMLSPDGKRLFYTRHGVEGNRIFTVDVAAIDAMRPAARR
jgi:hypothetical protein